jgi:plasmid stabilization system protein ParE
MIRDFIARDKPRAAKKWVAELRRQIRSLSRFPHRCEVIPEADEFGVDFRHLLFGSYRVIFSVEPDKVVVLRVIHSARVVSHKLWRERQE